MEITDMIFTTVGPGMCKFVKEFSDNIDAYVITAPGAIVVEWNVQQPNGKTGATGMWDSHIRWELTRPQLSYPYSMCFSSD